MVLVPGEALIYERDDRGVVYARYRDPPLNTTPRWIVGGPAETAHPLLNYGDWKDFVEVCNDSPTLKKQLDKIVDLYYLIKSKDTK